MPKIKFKRRNVEIKDLSDNELYQALASKKSLSISRKGNRDDKILREMKKRGNGSILKFLKG